MISFIYNERKQCENKSKTKRNFTEVSLQMISRTFFLMEHCHWLQAIDSFRRMMDMKRSHTHKYEHQR